MDFELRIIKVSWAAKDQPLGIEEKAWSPITLTPDIHGTYQADITAYPEVSGNRPGQLGILAANIDSPPLLIKANGEQSEMYPVKSSKGETWWIEKGKWQKKDEYHDAPICRHAGKAHIRIGVVDLHLNISAPGFSKSEFEILLEDFKNSLWELILNSTSPVTASTDRKAGISEEFFEAVRDHIRCSQDALSKPHLELKECEKEQSLDKVKPSNKTFKELAQKGSPRKISGRGHIPSYNTIENRFLFSIITKLYRALDSLHRSAIKRANDRANRSKRAEEKAHSYNEWKTVQPEILDQEINELQYEIERWKKMQVIS